MTAPVDVVAPAARWRVASMLVTRTAVPVCVQVAFHPLLTCWPVVGQLNARVQPSIGSVPVFVMSTLVTSPLPQSLVSVKATVQALFAGLVVVNISGGDGGDTRPAPSRAITLTV